MAAGERAGAKVCATCTWYRPGPVERAGRCGLAAIKSPLRGEGRLAVTIHGREARRVLRRVDAAWRGGAVMLESLVVGAVLAGCLGFAAWSVSVYIRTEVQAGADLTSKLIWNCGRACCWGAALVLAGGVFAAAVLTAARVVGGGRG